MKYNDLIPELVVSNINISRDFYVNMLGFKVEYEREEDKFYIFVTWKYPINVRRRFWRGIISNGISFGKGINFTFGVNNVDELYSKFKIKKNLLKRDIEIREFRVNDEIIIQKNFQY